MRAELFGMAEIAEAMLPATRVVQSPTVRSKGIQLSRKVYKARLKRNKQQRLSRKINRHRAK